MTDDKREIPLETQMFIDRAVEKTVDARIAGLTSKLKWFGLGLGAFFALLIGLGLASQSNLALEFLGKATGFENYLASQFKKQIAVSYHSQFWLGTDTDANQSKKLVFYAGPGQTAELRVEIRHLGPTEKLPIRVWLDENRDRTVIETAADGPNHMKIEEFGDQMSQGPRPDSKVHELHFELIEGFETFFDESGAPAVDEFGERLERPIQDRVFIAAMVNVYGHEEQD